MRQIEKLNLNYSGYASPEDTFELELEIMGLKTAIASAELRIAVLQQSLKTVQIVNLVKQGEENEDVVEEDKQQG